MREENGKSSRFESRMSNMRTGPWRKVCVAEPGLAPLTKVKGIPAEKEAVWDRPAIWTEKVVMKGRMNRLAAGPGRTGDLGE